MQWHDENAPRCPSCRTLYSEKKPPQKPPCGQCRVEVTEENEGPLAVYMITRRQYVTAEQGRVVDINILAVKAVMDLMGVENQKRCLLLVQRLFHEFYKHPEAK